MKYRKKPIIIDAFQWTGDSDQIEDPEWIVAAIKADKVKIEPGVRSPSASIGPLTYPVLKICTLEGTMFANPGDWIIKGIKGEIYPCKANIFEMTYEKVE